MIQIANKTYINPISKGSTNKYYFQIEDTAYTNLADTVFIISFRPLKNTNFDGLKGVLSINSRGWAIQNVKAEPALLEGFNIRIRQLYKLINDEKWFPVQLNTDVIFYGIVAGSDSNALPLIGIGKSYIKDIELNPEIIKRKLGTIGVEVEPNATSRDYNYWNAYRIDSLSQRDLRTYEFMDSIGREANFDKIALSFETVMKGSIPWKIFNIELDKIIRYNTYEGIYLGLGAHTNEKLSKFFSVGGFWGYGFKDQKTKYGGNIKLNLYRAKELELKLNYYIGVSESGGVHFFDDKDALLRPENFRDFLIERKNRIESFEAGFLFRAFKHFKWFVGLKTSYKYAFQDYEFKEIEDGQTTLATDYRFTDLIVGTRFAFREKIIKTTRASISLGTDYPVVWMQYTRGIKDVFQGDYNYNRIDLRVEKSFYTKYLGETSIGVKVGYINGDLPYCNLYNGNGSYRVFTIYAPLSFATMRMNEFLSNQYIAAYFSHNFGKLLVRKKGFSPEFVITTNIAFGSLNNAEDHKNVTCQNFEFWIL